jgi:hypothetical protein
MAAIATEARSTGVRAEALDEGEAEPEAEAEAEALAASSGEERSPPLPFPPFPEEGEVETSARRGGDQAVIV